MARPFAWGWPGRVASTSRTAPRSDAASRTSKADDLPVLPVEHDECLRAIGWVNWNAVTAWHQGLISQGDVGRIGFGVISDPHRSPSCRNDALTPPCHGGSGLPMRVGCYLGRCSTWGRVSDCCDLVSLD